MSNNYAGSRVDSGQLEIVKIRVATLRGFLERWHSGQAARQQFPVNDDAKRKDWRAICISSFILIDTKSDGSRRNTNDDYENWAHYSLEACMPNSSMPPCQTWLNRDTSHEFALMVWIRYPDR